MANASFEQVANTGEAWLPEAGGQRGDPGSPSAQRASPPVARGAPSSPAPPPRASPKGLGVLGRLWRDDTLCFEF